MSACVVFKKTIVRCLSIIIIDHEGIIHDDAPAIIVLSFEVQHASHVQVFEDIAEADIDGDTGYAGMLVVAGLWAIWHNASGLALAQILRMRTIRNLDKQIALEVIRLGLRTQSQVRS